uniref:Gcp-like domain-containing protein n=1 Tax=Oryza rufipogon TaxID=4529 RepID=A0A0E0MV14_ORYRU
MPSAAGSRATPDHGNLLMLGIETSCDDTAAAVVRGDGEILSQVVSSQEDLLVRWGGVAPKMAEEAHLLAIDRVVQKALDNANVSESDLSAVAVTYDLRPRWPLGEEYSDGRCVARSMKTARVHPSLASMIQGSVH